MDIAIEEENRAISVKKKINGKKISDIFRSDDEKHYDNFFVFLPIE